MRRIRKRTCRHCRERFEPECRHLKRQKFCGALECRKASHRHSQCNDLKKEHQRCHPREKDDCSPR